MQIVHTCIKCKAHFEFYFNDKVPYTNEAILNNVHLKAFDFQSIIGASKFDDKSEVTYSVHKIPCPYCDEINNLYYELIK